MLNRVAAVVLVLASASLAAAQPAADAALTKGMAQVQDGQWDDAVSTLNDVVKRLSGAPARKEELAQAYLWLGIAYGQLDSEKSSRASFREAVKLDPRVSLAEGWPAKVARVFAAVKGEAGSPVPAATAPAEKLSAEESAVNDKVQRLAGAGQLDEAEALLRDWMARHPGSARACGWLAEFLLHDFPGRPARFDDGMTVADRCIPLDDPTNARSRQTLAQKYLEKAYGDASLTDEQKERYADEGLKYADLALKIKPNLVDSILVKAILLRTKVRVAKDDKTRKAYLAEAQLLQDHAKALRAAGKGEFSGADPLALGPSATSPGVVGGVAAAPPPPPPVLEPVRVGGAIKEPRKTKHVEFVYPEIAKSARVQGVVIMECTISPEGKVVDVKVLKGNPLLDGAAIDAVKQWEYTPTLLNGIPVPVIMTVTANFRLS